MLKRWFWRRLLRIPWTARSNQSFLKEINPEYSLEELKLKLKLQYFGHMMQRADSLEKTLVLGKAEGKRRRGQQRMRWLDSNTNSTDMNKNKFWEKVEDRGTWHTAIYGVTESQTQLLNWTTNSRATFIDILGRWQTARDNRSLGGRQNSIETCILSRVKQITSPGWIHETSARGWCTGKTQRDWVEREVGGGFRMGNTCKSMADSSQCMANTTPIL